MTEYDVFEARIVAALRDYASAAPTEVDGL